MKSNILSAQDTKKRNLNPTEISSHRPVIVIREKQNLPESGLGLGRSQSKIDKQRRDVKQRGLLGK